MRKKRERKEKRKENEQKKDKKKNKKTKKETKCNKKEKRKKKGKEKKNTKQKKKWLCDLLDSQREPIRSRKAQHKSRKRKVSKRECTEEAREAWIPRGENGPTWWCYLTFLTKREKGYEGNPSFPHSLTISSSPFLSHSSLFLFFFLLFFFSVMLLHSVISRRWAPWSPMSFLQVESRFSLVI